MKIRPVDDRVIVKVTEAATVSKGGIALVAGRQTDQSVKATVVAVGPGRILKNGHRGAAPDVKVGDIAVYGSNSGTEIKIEGEAFVVLREDDILAVIAK